MPNRGEQIDHAAFIILLLLRLAVIPDPAVTSFGMVFRVTFNCCVIEACRLKTRQVHFGMNRFSKLKTVEFEKKVFLYL